MKNKIGLKILVISVVLVMFVSCVTPCIAVSNTTNNISNSSFSLEDTPVNVSVENTSKSLINENEIILAMLIVEEGVKVEDATVIHRESLGDLNLDALFVGTKASEVPELSERVKNIFFPKKVEASFLVEPAKAVMIAGTETPTYDKKHVVVSGVYSAQELLKFAKEGKIVRLMPEIEELKIEEIEHEKLDGFLSSLAVLTPEDKVNAIVELKDIPKYKGLSYKEASEKTRKSEVVKDAVKAVEDLGGDFIDYWHWYDSIDVEIEASKLSELARYEFVEKITWGGVKWKIEPMVGVEATDVRPTEEINEIIYYLNARHLHNREYNGSGVKVGIIDTGIDESHPEFDDAIIVKKPENDVTGTGFDDYVGHGTAVASCVNYVAPKAELWIYKDGNESTGFINDTITCIDKAMKEVDIISLSSGTTWLNPPYDPLGHWNYSGTLRDGTSDFCMKVDEAILNWNKTFVNSAGNKGNNHDYREIGENAANYSFDVENLDKKIEIRVWWDDEDGNLSDKPENNLYLDIYENETNIHDDHDWIIGDSFQHVEFTPETTGTYKASVSFRPGDYEEEEKQDYHIQISGADFDLTVKVGGVSDELNMFNTTTDPANAFLVISVGALKHDYEQIADLSSRGPTRDGRIKPEIVAPGWYIPVAVSSKSPDYKEGNYTSKSGTSLSAPLVSGCIALFMQAHPEYKNDSRETHLKLLISALDMGESGPDNIYGYEGLVDAFGMLSAFGDRNCPKPNVKIEYSEVGAKVKFKVKLTNSGDSSSEANGGYIKLENATFESVANGTFDGSYAYNISNPEEVELRPWEHHLPVKGSKVVELCGSGNNAESGEIVINPEKDISDVKINYRAWILDEDDIIENPYNNESEVNAYFSLDVGVHELNEGRKEPYIARDPPESEPENPAYNRHIFDTDYSFLNYSCYGSTIIYVPDDYAKIRDAVNTANVGDAIIVRDGTYVENVNVDRHLTIRSENGSANCIVQAANPYDPVFEVTADYVNIGGFTVQETIHYLKAGIYLDNVNFCNISNNNVSNNRIAIWLKTSSNNKIINNNVSFNEAWGNGIGIKLSDSSYNEIANNMANSNDWQGIVLVSSTNNELTDNSASKNRETGIALSESSNNNTITNNNIASNGWAGPMGGINVWKSNNNKIYLNNFINNTINVQSYESSNIWNSTEKINYRYKGEPFTNYLGNYWDDYKEKYPDAEEIDECGIWDIPYSIDGDEDNYPLMKPFKHYFKPVENQPPTASFTFSPSYPFVDQEVTFDASDSTDSDGTIVSYEWDFGDGNTATEKIVTHLYSSARSYDVSLTVTDDDGATADEKKSIITSLKIVYVDDDFDDDPASHKWNTIQECVDDAIDGVKIIVYDGVYTENIKVNKPHLTIQSENGAANCIVHAALDWGYVFEVTAGYVNISGFNVTGAMHYGDGIHLSNVNHCNIVDNTVSNNDAGIYLNQTDHCNISSNNASNNECGIILEHSSNNTLTNNIASDNSRIGIGMWDSNNNILQSNTVNSNNYEGIHLSHSSSNTLHNNTATNSINWPGISLNFSSNNTLSSNIANGNNNHGICLLSSNNNTLQSNIANSNNGSGIVLYSSSNNNALSSNTANSNNIGGIYLYSSNNNTLTNNTATRSSGYSGIRLYSSNNNTLSSNTANSNNWHGICLDSSSSNTLTNNIASDNSRIGVGMWDSSNNNITCNLVQNNILNGFYLYESINNNISFNNIIENGNYNETTGGYEWQFENDQSDDIDASDNWWGRNDETNISASIYDWNDDPGRGVVTYLPKLGQPASCAPTPEEPPAFTTADAAVALEIAVGSCEYDPRWDVNDDGSVTSLDALMILQAAAGAISL